MQRHTILVVDDEDFIRLNLKNIFGEDYDLLLCGGEEALALVKSQKVDLALLDLNLGKMNGLDVLQAMRELQPELLVIIMTGFSSVESAVEALKRGAYDYIKKPFKADAIKLIVRLAIEKQELGEQVKALTQKDREGLEGIWGESEAIARVKHLVREFARFDDETVLVTGESGSGKELVARSLHGYSSRNTGPFVEINCASIPENLLESELFGYEKGAFTDARSPKEGLLEKADKGTLFLDEIGEMSPGLQAKLLRVLESKSFRRLGGTREIRLNLRIVAATNVDLKSAIQEKLFREDLFYRLNVLRIEIPPLREREDDVMVLARRFLELFSGKFNRQITGFAPEVQTILRAYQWPGNARELKNIIERICILQRHSTVRLEDLPGEITEGVPGGDVKLPEAVLGEKSLGEILDQTERQLIERALRQADHNTTRAARLLKIPRETLRYKLTKYGLDSGEN